MCSVYLVGKVSGEPVDDFLRQRIFTLLGMARHRFSCARTESVASRGLL